MDYLHLSYDEVVRKIPYRNLQVMMRDKQRVAYGKVYREVDEDEFGIKFS